MSTPDPRTRTLRAISGVSRAARDADALAESLTGHLGSVAWEVATDLSYNLRRLMGLARRAGASDRAIESARE